MKALVLQPGYGTGGAAYVVSGPERRPEVFAGRQAPCLRAQAQSLCASGFGRGRRTSAHARGKRERQKQGWGEREGRQHPERRGGLGLRRRTGGAQQLLLVSGRARHYFLADG